MKVYVVEHGWRYEGFSIVGIYRTRKQAEKIKADLSVNLRSSEYIGIEEFEVGEEVSS